LFGSPAQHLQSGAHWLLAVDELHEHRVGSEVPQQQLDDWQHVEAPLDLQQQSVSQQQVANNQDGAAINKQAMTVVMWRNWFITKL